MALALQCRVLQHRAKIRLYDLIVVGAGPAGASAARTAAQLGLKTLLLEKDKLPRNKLCGGGVTPKVLKLLGFGLPDELIEYTARSTRIHVGEGCFNFETDRTLVYMTSRTRLDSFLADKAVEAGAELKDGTPAHRIEDKRFPYPSENFPWLISRKDAYRC